MLPSYEKLQHLKENTRSLPSKYLNTDRYNAKILVEPYQGWYVVQNQTE